MGQIISANCSKCQTQKEIYAGGGMANFETTCTFPALCENCKKVVEINLCDKLHQCPECNSPNVIPYNDPSLSDCPDKPDDENIMEWNMDDKIVILKDKPYKCPKCNEMSLWFLNAGWWD